MPHFFIKSENISDDRVLIDDADNYRHLARSLRIKKGEKLLLIDENKIQYETIVDDITNDKIYALIKDKYPSKRFLPFEIYLAQSPLRSDAQSFVIEKATELGVIGVYPVCTDNCAVNQSIIQKKIDKWQRIMYESSKQCERADIPVCYQIEKLEALIDKFDRIFVFCERIATKTLRELSALTLNEKVLVIVGPEGGFSEREIELFKNNSKIEMLTLGDLILKAETAVTVGLGNLIYEFTSRN